MPTKPLRKGKSIMPNDFGKKILVEDCQKFLIDNFLKEYKLRLKDLFISSKLEVLGLQVNLTTSKTYNSGKRLWFVCPVCGGRVGALYLHPLTQNLGCRCCLGLRYKKHRYKGMLEDKIWNS